MVQAFFFTWVKFEVVAAVLVQQASNRLGKKTARAACKPECTPHTRKDIAYVTRQFNAMNLRRRLRCRIET